MVESMARKTKEEAEKTRCQLLDAAEQLFWERGVIRTSLEDIARHAGLTRGALYWHFDNKVDLFNGMCDRAFPPFEHMMAELMNPACTPGLNPAQRLWRHSNGVLRLVMDEPRIARVIGIINLRCEYVGEMEQSHVMDRCWLQEKLGNMRQVLAEADSAGLLRPEVDPVSAAASLHAMIFGLICNWLFNPDVYDLSCCPEKFLTPFFVGLFQQDSWLPPR